MSLLDPIQLMTLMGTTPERKGRNAALTGGFQSHMRKALGSQDLNALSSSMGGNSMENSLMQDALNGLAAIMRHEQTGIGSKRGSGKQPAIGDLSSTFESGAQGVNAIGYDRNGGTSYGTYQIASKPGTMKGFIEFLREKANRPGIKDIPVFMISTETGDDIIGEAKTLGAIGALKKPFTPDKVNEVLGPLM